MPAGTRGVLGGMKKLMIPTAVGALAVVLSACGSSNGNGSSSSKSPSAASQTISTTQVGGVGKVLVDASGMALYTPAGETAGNVRCTAVALRSCPDITLYVLPGAGHNHNIAPNRTDLWGRLATWAGWCWLRQTGAGPRRMRLVSPRARAMKISGITMFSYFIV